MRLPAIKPGSFAPSAACDCTQYQPRAGPSNDSTAVGVAHFSVELAPRARSGADQVPRGHGSRAGRRAVIARAELATILASTSDQAGGHADARRYVESVDPRHAWPARQRASGRRDDPSGAAAFRVRLGPGFAAVGSRATAALQTACRR